MSVEVQILLMCLVFFLILSVIQSILIVVLARTLKEVPDDGQGDDDDFDTHIASVIDQVLLERLPAYRQPTVWTKETKRTEYEPKARSDKSRGVAKNGE